MAGPATVEALGLPFDEAIAYLRDKVDIPTERWTDLWQGMHARGFVVAGATKMELLTDFHDAVNAAIADGTTLADFQRQFDAIVAKHGWDFRGGRKWRAGVIFNTNLRMAYAAGKWAQVERLADRRPWLRYVAVMDDRTRDEHRRWHNTILPVDHPWWRTHAPPNGWGCRCTIQSLSDADLARLGLAPSAAAPEMDWETRPLRGNAGGPDVQVPAGIDTGFAYNVGEAAWGRGEHRRMLAEEGGFEDLAAHGVPQLDRAMLPPIPVDAPRGNRRAVDENDAAEIRQAFRRALGGAPDRLAEAIWADPTGARIHVTEAVVDHILEDPAARAAGRVRYFDMMQETVEAPFEVWVGWAVHRQTGKVELRRRYVKQVDIGDGRYLSLVIDARRQHWVAFNLITSDRPGGVAGSRKGLLLYRRR